MLEWIDYGIKEDDPELQRKLLECIGQPSHDDNGAFRLSLTNGSAADAALESMGVSQQDAREPYSDWSVWVVSGDRGYCYVVVNKGTGADIAPVHHGSKPSQQWVEGVE